MVLWLEDLTDDHEDEGAPGGTGEATERVLDLTEDATSEGGEAQVAPLHDERIQAEVQAAEDEGLSLADLEAARFTRH